MEKVCIRTYIDVNRMVMDGRAIDLDSTLLSAAVENVRDSERDTALILRYDHQGGEEFLAREIEKIFEVAQESNSTRGFQVNAYTGEELPTLAVVGEFRAEVYRY